jgi:hypothetical protein
MKVHTVVCGEESGEKQDCMEQHEHINKPGKNCSGPRRRLTVEKGKA